MIDGFDLLGEGSSKVSTSWVYAAGALCTVCENLTPASLSAPCEGRWF